MPLPSDETTPPVMKTYFVLMADLLLAQTRLCRGEVLGRVDADRVSRRLPHVDAIPRLEPPQLLEGFRPLQRRRRQRRDLRQCLRAIRVDAEVLAVGGLALPEIWDGRSREIQGPAVACDGDLDGVGIRRRGRRDRIGER